MPRNGVLAAEESTPNGNPQVLHTLLYTSKLTFDAVLKTTHLHCIQCDAVKSLSKNTMARLICYYGSLEKVVQIYRCKDCRGPATLIPRGLSPTRRSRVLIPTNQYVRHQLINDIYTMVHRHSELSTTEKNHILNMVKRLLQQETTGAILGGTKKE